MVQYKPFGIYLITIDAPYVISSIVPQIMFINIFIPQSRQFVMSVFPFFGNSGTLFDMNALFN